MFSTAAFTSWGELQADDDEALDELGPDEGDIEVVVAKDLKGVIGVPAKKIHYLIENNFNKYNSFRNVFFTIINNLEIGFIKFGVELVQSYLTRAIC